MHRYAIEITAQDLDLITLLNQGVTPVVEDRTYFVFDATWNSEEPNQIVTEEELVSLDEFDFRPTIYRLK